MADVYSGEVCFGLFVIEFVLFIFIGFITCRGTSTPWIIFPIFEKQRFLVLRSTIRDENRFFAFFLCEKEMSIASSSYYEGGAITRFTEL
ncbi:hypothetical protein HM131_04110 [Halobacillus mangrovi]|uniref:Uncharacterized protein n=1 Tax=Halobacillus mangrovi TaxID=402384 RepID=A0A1W5ZS05_9BACI|nr:hypothetical protein HM131_04110 [Halobacillus mangrovi]